MLTDKWLNNIGLATQTLFWAVGYFFGFTLVTALSFGMLLPGSFPDIGKSRKHAWHILYKREGRVFLVSEAVAFVGWFFLFMLNMLIFSVTAGG